MQLAHWRSNNNINLNYSASPKANAPFESYFPGNFNTMFPQAENKDLEAPNFRENLNYL